MVVEQVFAPAKVLVVAGLCAHAVLKPHHLPVHALQLAFAAQRNDGAHGFVLLGRAQFAAHAALQADDAGAGAAGDALGAGQLHLHRRAAVRAVELAALLVFGGLVFQALQVQVFQQHGAPALDVRRVLGVGDAEHLAAAAAQLHQVKRLAQRWQLRQLALGGNQLRLAAEGHAVGLAVDGGGHADAKARRFGQIAPGRAGAGEDVAAVVLAQAGDAAVGQKGRPFRPDAGLGFVLQAPDQREGLLLAVERDAPAGHELQRAVVVEQLGHLADAREHVAVAHHGALAVAADGVGGLRAFEFHRRATAGAGRTVKALGGRGRRWRGGIGGHRGLKRAARPGWARFRSFFGL